MTDERPAYIHGSFWIGLFDRALKTFLQTLLTVWGVGDEMIEIYNLNIGQALALGGTAALLSIITSFVSSGVGDRGTTSFMPGGK